MPVYISSAGTVVRGYTPTGCMVRVRFYRLSFFLQPCSVARLTRNTCTGLMTCSPLCGMVRYIMPSL